MIIILTSCLSFYSCGPKDYYNYIPQHKIPVYKEGDTLIYKSQNNYDTFIYTKRRIFYDSYVENYYNQAIDYLIRNKNDSDLGGYVGLQLDLTMLSWLHFSIPFTNNVIANDSLISINNIVYHNVYQFDKTSSDTNHYYATRIYFTYKNWVIRYFRNDSTTWDLIYP